MKNYSMLFSYSAFGIITLAFLNLVACGKSSSNINPLQGSGGDISDTSGVGGDVGGAGGTEGQSTVGGSGTGTSGVEAGNGGSVESGAGGSVTDPFDSGAPDGSDIIPVGGDGGAGGETTPTTRGPVTMVAGTEPVAAGCQGLLMPQVTDYTLFDDLTKDPPVFGNPFETTVEENTGPGGAFTLFRPTNLDESGSLHPIATWGNGMATTPTNYVPLLSAFAGHGFVVIASNSSTVNSSLLTQGLDWLIQQNAAGPFQGKLATQCALSIGYSMGGGACIGAGAHASVVATVHMHGLSGASGALHGPLLVTTSTDDTFVTPAGNSQPTYNACTQPAIMATLQPTDVSPLGGHIRPVNTAGDERAPALAWARLWMYGDSEAKKYFFGADCILCLPPWINIQRKNYTW